ncbi:glutamine--fructose-6-phosphate aminotransferase [Thermococcus sp. P6]|uniref:glutamine--fructose-6-phosphate transaminase (isomerizing) n=1 Tax=Thermococcus sp. P6 TaxID=122420 RepID=UPI000B5A1E5D|nr:glutamine--fructose-6-phosphate transaminase (isomerizing) [Thermococcus sp. P6]ASJ11230.1 glutamine--fructose-6-phosphate aminotransferase [Thermococcus sp. P6]
MCGIIGYVGDRKACEVIVRGLKRLEYRGYDSAGIVTGDNGRLYIKKGAGRVDELREKLGFLQMPGKIGIGHTRWATHGVPDDTNAHPHTDCTGRIALVHNGIIENFSSLREWLVERGHTFRSNTDTEVIAHLIEEELKSGGSFEEAMRRALLRLRGSFALGIIYAGEPDRLYFVRNESPLVLGIGRGENFAASDVPAFLEYTKRAVFLDDGEYAILTKDSWIVKNLYTGEVVEKEVQEIEWDLEMAEKSGYEHFTLKEIYEQPRAVRDAIHGNAEVVRKVAEEIAGYDRIFIVAMGTSYHAGLVAKYLFQRLTRRVPIVEEASEFRYEFGEILNERDLVLAITQSGETADTLAAMRLAKERGAKVLAIVNVVGSMATRVADLTLYTHAGPEIGVAATKTYTTQLTVLTMLAIELARILGTTDGEELRRLEENLKAVPELMEKVLGHDGALRELAEGLLGREDFFYIARGINVPTALEGALKLKEISYVHAEGLSAGELKHGPLALLENGVPVVAIAPGGRTFDKMVANIEEARARGAHVIGLGEEPELRDISDVFIEMPGMDELLTPIVYALPLQLLAYHLSVLRGNDPDRPRNLAKSVTVE